jgi:hypothetical protein
MHPNRQHGPVLRSAVVGLAAASTLVLSACGDTEGPETGASVEEVQQDPGGAVEPGVFDNDYSDAGSYVGQEVTVSAEVNDVVSPTAFTIAGTAGTTVDELLVLQAAGGPEITEDSVVQVTGTVREGFDVVEAEGFVGTDLDDGLFTDWTGENYIEASSVDLTVPEEGTAPTTTGTG